MSKVPGYFEYLQEAGRGSGLSSFVYDQTARQFLIDDQTVALKDFDPYNYNPYVLNGIDYEGLPVTAMPETALLIPSHGGLIVGPNLHNWAQENIDSVLAATDVMHEAYTQFVEDSPDDISSERSVGHFGFNAGLREDGGIHLQVLGDCACMGPDPHSHTIEGHFENGYAQYELHNADYPMQRASLYAGLGYLAFLAEGRDPAQATLF